MEHFAFDCTSYSKPCLGKVFVLVLFYACHYTILVGTEYTLGKGYAK